ncbi:voltage-gated potassium channel [Aureococcus anophagefferens]|nr:voltage-gated potassium channel [Aureococcus anophagefferens]
MAQHRASWTETKLELTRTLSTKYPPSSEIFRAGRSKTQRFLEGLYDGTRERAQLTHTKIAHRLDKLSVGKFTIDPLASRAMHQWDVTVSLALVYTVLVPPAEIAFARRINAWSATGDRWGLFLLSLGNLLVWSVFVFDGITRHYLRTAFALDFVSIVPFGYLSLLAGPYTAGREVRALKLLRLLRLTKLLRMYRTSRLLLRYRSDNTMSIGMSNIASVICGFVIASHWLACLWGYVGNNSAPIENTWMAAYLDGGDSGPDRGGWNIRDPKFQYLMSLYFTLTTLTTVGYGDVLPKNVAERSVATLMILFGGMLWSLIIAAITQTVATLDSDHITYNRHDQINRMLVDLQLDAIVKLEIFKTLGHLLFAPEEIVNVQKTLMIITNHGFIGTKGRLKMIGDALFLDFLVSDDEPPPMAVVLKFCEVATIRRADIFEVCAAPAATTPLLYALLGPGRGARLQGREDLVEARVLGGVGGDEVRREREDRRGAVGVADGEAPESSAKARAVSGPSDTARAGATRPPPRVAAADQTATSPLEEAVARAALSAPSTRR